MFIAALLVTARNRKISNGEIQNDTSMAKNTMFFSILKYYTTDFFLKKVITYIGTDMDIW